MTLSIAACRNERAGPSSPTTLAVAATSTSVSALSTSASGTTETSTLTPTSTASDSVAVEPVPGLGMPGLGVLVASQQGIFIVDGESVFTPLVEGKAWIAVDDTTGGILFQRMEPGTATASAETMIWWVPAGEAVPLPLLVPADGQYLRLNDVVELEGEPVVFYTRTEGSGPEDLSKTLHRFGLLTEESIEIAEVGGWEASANVTVSESMIALEWSAEAWGGFRFLDHAGQSLDVAANPYSPEGVLDCAPCPRSLAVFDDGERLAYIEGYDVGDFFVPHLVLVDVDSGEELIRLAIGEFGYDLDGLGDVVVVNEFDMDYEPLPARVVWLLPDPPHLTEAPIDGKARIIRSRITVERPLTFSE